MLTCLACGLKFKFGYDDSLDVVGVHGVGGFTGTVNVTATIVDDDLITPDMATLTIANGTDGTLNVHLADNPGAAGLTVSIASSNMGAVTVAPASRMYTGGGGGNFATPQAFTISAVTGMAGMTSMLTLSAPGQADKIVMVTVN